MGPHVALGFPRPGRPGVSLLSELGGGGGEQQGAEVKGVVTEASLTHARDCLSLMCRPAAPSV